VETLTVFVLLYHLVLFLITVHVVHHIISPDEGLQFETEMLRVSVISIQYNQKPRSIQKNIHSV